MCSCIAMATASSLTRVDRIGSSFFRFNPLSSCSCALVDVPKERIFPAARVSVSLRGGRSCRPFLFTSSYAHYSKRLFSIPKAKSRSTMTTTAQTSSSEDNSSQGTLQKPTVLRMVLEIIGFIVRLSGTLLGFLKKEDRALNEIEEDIDQVANLVKVAAKGIEEVAQGIEKFSEVVEKDAETVDGVMDKVKEETKTVHESLEIAIGTLQGSVQGVQAKAAQEKQLASDVEGKVATEQKETEEAIKDKTGMYDSSTLAGNTANLATAWTTSTVYRDRYPENSSGISTYNNSCVYEYKQLEQRRWWAAMGGRAAVVLVMMVVAMVVRSVDLTELVNRALFLILSTSRVPLAAAAA